jgi:four helix bundle protein
LPGSAPTICSSKFIGRRIGISHRMKNSNSIHRFVDAAYSVPANIVEGNARDSAREKLRYFNVAAASLNETGYGLHAAHRLGYLSDDVFEALFEQLKSVGAPLHGLIRERRAEVARLSG